MSRHGLLGDEELYARYSADYLRSIAEAAKMLPDRLQKEFQDQMQVMSLAEFQQILAKMTIATRRDYQDSLFQVTGKLKRNDRQIAQLIRAFMSNPALRCRVKSSAAHNCRLTTS